MTKTSLESAKDLPVELLLKDPLFIPEAGVTDRGVTPCEPFRERGFESYPGGGERPILAKIGVGGFAPFVCLVLPFLLFCVGDEFGEYLLDVGVVEIVDILSFLS